jgi:hypothetical protein
MVHNGSLKIQNLRKWGCNEFVMLARNDALRGVRLIDRESVDLFMESL